MSEKRKLSPYFYLVIIILVFMTWGMCQYKIQPILNDLMLLMGIDEAKGGFLVSAINILAIFITIPLGVVMGKIGPRKTGFLGMGLILLGSIIGTFCTKNFYLMMISQLIVGAGGASVSILGPYVIPMLFVPELRGRANGFYMTAGTISQLLMYNVVPRITSASNLAPAWCLTNIFTIVMLLIWFLFASEDVFPKQEEKHRSSSEVKKVTMLDALKDGKVLQLFLGITFFMMSASAIIGFSPSYLIAERGYDAVTAGSLVSVSALVGAVATAVGGTLSDLLKTRKWIYFIALLWMVVSKILIVVLPNGILLNLTIWGQGIPSVCMGLIYTVAGEVIDVEKRAVTMSVLSTGSKIGAFFAATVFGIIVTAFGYQTTFFVYAGITCLAAFGVCTIKGVK